MKVIDLLNKIANGEEVPEKIQVYSDIFVLDYSNNVYEHEKTRTNLLSIYNGNILNYEVGIKEEDKKIEKLDYDRNDISYCEGNMKNDEEMVDIVLEIKDKINEIIDYLEEEDNE
jgi:hypothetical protein